MNYLKFLEPLINNFEKLPGVGKKTATRYAMAVVDSFTDENVVELANTLIKIKKTIRHCRNCHILTDKEICDICSDTSRNKSQILVVKDTKDVLSIEKSGQYIGLYHVLGGLISPLDGIGPDELTIDLLEKRTKNSEVNEIILATSFTPSGETTALYLEKILNRKGLDIYKIGYGLPAGGDIEYADELTLRKALEVKKRL